MPKKYIPITTLLLVLGLVAIVGYAMPEKRPDIPVRIHFANGGGSVIFSHEVHAGNYSIDCDTCHHHEPTASPSACGLCHPKTMDETYIKNHQNSFKDMKTCVQCHHLEFDSFRFKHVTHEEYAPECTDCHHGKDIEPEPQACSNCHSQKGDEAVVALRDAGHTRCMGCHEEFFDEGLKGCTSCHRKKKLPGPGDTLGACKKCHYDAEGKGSTKLLTTRANAFHGQCMGCHKKMQKGPYRDNECKTCHNR